MSKLIKDYKLLKLNYPTEVTRCIYRIKDQYSFNDRIKDRSFFGKINYPNKTESISSYATSVLHLDTSAINVNNIKIIDNWLIGDISILDTKEGLLIQNLSDYEYRISLVTNTMVDDTYEVANGYRRLIRKINDIIKSEVYLTLHDYSEYLEQTKGLFDYYLEDNPLLSNN